MCDSRELDPNDPAIKAMVRRELFIQADAIIELLLYTDAYQRVDAAARIDWRTGKDMVLSGDPALQLAGAALQLRAALKTPDVFVDAVGALYREICRALDVDRHQAR